MFKLHTEENPTFTDGTLCGHCGERRLVAPLRTFFKLQKMHPISGMYNVLVALQANGSPKMKVSICPNCFCITSDLGICSD